MAFFLNLPCASLVVQMVKLPKLSNVELAVGFLIQLPFYYLIGNWVFALAGLSSVLWALGGAEGSNKAFRRFLVPFASCAFLWFLYDNRIGILAIYPLAVLVVSKGYGEKSWLWRMFFDETKDWNFSDYATRMILYILYWFVFGIGVLIK